MTIAPPRAPGEIDETPAEPPATGAATPVMPLVAAVPVAVAGGLLLDTAFPGVGAWPLAIVAPALLLLTVRGRSARTGYWLAALFGIAFMVAHLQWTGTFVGAMPWLALSVLEGLIAGLVGLLWPACWRLAARPGWQWSLPLTAGAVWVAAEAVRARVPFGGFPWARIAFSQADSPLVWVAPLAGAPGVGFVVVAAAGCLALAAMALIRPTASSARISLARRSAAALAPVVAAVLAVGALIVAGHLSARTERAGDGRITVAAVQGNVPEAGLDFNSERRAVTDNHARVTQDLAARIAAGEVPPVDVVIWPENSSDIDPLTNPDAARVISRAADAIDAPMLVGAVLDGPGENITNATLVWDPRTGYRGDDGGKYAKQEPVPFAEYIPYRAFFRAITPLVDEVPRNFAPGPGPRVLDVGGAAIGPVICFEISDDDVVGNQVRAGADMLAVPTNNATFGYTDESTQQFAMTRFRAVEYGRTTIQASTVGVSGIVLPDGSTSRLTGLYTADSLVADVPLRSGHTLSAVVGQWPEIAVSLTVAIAALLLPLPAGLRRRGRAMLRSRADRGGVSATPGNGPE